MKHPLLILSLFGGLALAINGCSSDDGNGKLTQPKPSESSNNNEESSVSRDTSPTEPVQTPRPVTPPDAGTSFTNTQKSCGLTTNAVECAQCCVSQHNPLAGCACNAGSQCQAACGTNFCTGDLPNIQCAMCIFQAKCQLGDTSNLQSDVQTCMQQSACQTKQGANGQH